MRHSFFALVPIIILLSLAATGCATTQPPMQPERQMSDQCQTMVDHLPQLEANPGPNRKWQPEDVTFTACRTTKHWSCETPKQMLREASMRLGTWACTYLLGDGLHVLGQMVDPESVKILGHYHVPSEQLQCILLELREVQLECNDHFRDRPLQFITIARE